MLDEAMINSLRKLVNGVFIGEDNTTIVLEVVTTDDSLKNRTSYAIVKSTDYTTTVNLICCYNIEDEAKTLQRLNRINSYENCCLYLRDNIIFCRSSSTQIGISSVSVIMDLLYECLRCYKKFNS